MRNILFIFLLASTVLGIKEVDKKQAASSSTESDHSEELQRVQKDGVKVIPQTWEEPDFNLDPMNKPVPLPEQASKLDEPTEMDKKMRDELTKQLGEEVLKHIANMDEQKDSLSLEDYYDYVVDNGGQANIRKESKEVQQPPYVPLLIHQIINNINMPPPPPPGANQQPLLAIDPPRKPPVPVYDDVPLLTNNQGKSNVDKTMQTDIVEKNVLVPSFLAVSIDLTDIIICILCCILLAYLMRKFFQYFTSRRTIPTTVAPVFQVEQGEIQKYHE